MMTLNKAQFDQLVENYVNHIIEGLDNESMESMLTDLLIREYETYTEEQIIGEVTDIYGEEIAQELLESVTAVPVA
jgi:tRNA U54 and U55 pseudouridine synthase Pus10